MRTNAQVRVAFLLTAVSALLMAFDVLLNALALRHVSHMRTTMLAEQTVAQVRAGMVSNLVVAAVGAVVFGVLVVFVRWRSNKVRAAVWIAGPLLALSLLCGLVAGPEWAVAPTGMEPLVLRQELDNAVPDWYTTAHGAAGISTVALVLFLTAWMTRAHMREYYQNVQSVGSYHSWVQRTGGE